MLQPLTTSKGPIGVFDSGYGGLTVLRSLVKQLPQYDFCYLGDSARSPYGNRSFEAVYQYTLEAVQWFFNQGCPLVILACNTASAKALRSIQQKELAQLAPANRVLGVIRPTTEVLGQYTKTGAVGILATEGTVQSQSYPIEIEKFYPQLKVYQEACPMWVPLIENNEQEGPGADYFVKKHLDAIFKKDPAIDLLLLACTHYPLLEQKIRQYLPPTAQLLSQGEIVANSLVDYLKRHPEIANRCSQQSTLTFNTTDSAVAFDKQAAHFFGAPVSSQEIQLIPGSAK
ncbi:MAG: glutamate racemase [Bacteroidota bacterium]